LLSLFIKTTKFLAYPLLLVVEDRFCRLPRRSVQPEVERLLREELPLNAQVIALVLELKRARRGPWPCRKKKPGGRPPLAQDLRDLIIRLKTENLFGGAHRIED